MPYLAYTKRLCKIIKNILTRSYNEASLNPQWVKAMNRELKDLDDNHTLDIVPLPSGKKPIGNRWVYKVKFNSDGSLE